MRKTHFEGETDNRKHLLTNNEILQKLNQTNGAKYNCNDRVATRPKIWILKNKKPKIF